MCDIFDPLPPVVRENLRWVPDSQTAHCMNCNVAFSVLTRKHHCRKCGNVVCKHCSPNSKKLSEADPFPVRVCNTCYASVDEHFAHQELSGSASAEASCTDSLVKGRTHLGQVYVKVVEAIGLPSTDSLTCDPFVRVILTGRWSHQQEWGTDLRNVRHTKRKSRTLNPRWHETFMFNIFAPNAELVFEIYNHGQLSQATKLGEATITLDQLMDQRIHNKWLDLTLTTTTSKQRRNSTASSNSALSLTADPVVGGRAGRIHVLLHYKFSRAAEFLSHFAEEQPYVYSWPNFKAATLYSNFWVLLDDLWPYLEVIWAISPILNWEHPTRSAFWFGLCIWLCLCYQWIPVIVHLVLIAYTLRNYFNLTLKNYSPVSKTAEVVEDNNISDTEGEDYSRHIYKLPQGLHHITNRMTKATIDSETKRTLKNVQNNLGWWSGIIKNIALLFSWEDFFYTAHVLVGLIASCVLHVLLPNQYLLLVLVVFLFVQWTTPYKALGRMWYGLHTAIRSLLHQQRLLAAHDKKSPNGNAGPRVNGGVGVLPSAGRPNRAALQRGDNGSPTSPSPPAPLSKSKSKTSFHTQVVKREEMFGAAAAAISRSFDQIDQSRK